jgi:Dolichyl-phosphate-mannose-protein mannosyltransferase
MRTRALPAWVEPVAVGVAVALVVLWAAGTLTRPAVIADESAYLLQAGIFTHGHWTSPAPSLPEFFEQLYVLVTPVLASKYPPGESLILTPFVWAGVPGLAPILLSGLTGALLYALARRLGGRWVALLTVLWWLAIDQTIYARVMYMSEVTTAAMWLLAWWAALRWRDRGSQGALALASAAVGWTLITRPLTGVALAIPLAFVFARQMQGVRWQWRPITIACGVLALVLSIIPIDNVHTTGRWLESPLALYTRQYMPFDGPGFGAGTARPLRPLPADLAPSQEAYYLLHRDHHLSALPHDLAARLYYIGRNAWGGWRWPLLAFALIGLASVGAEAVVAIVTAALLVLLYLSYPHPPYYTLYYLEADPVLAFVTALGVLGIARRLKTPFATQTMTALLLLTSAIGAASAAVRARAANARDVAYEGRFDALLAPLQHGHAIVFVRFAPTHNPYQFLVRNDPDAQHAPVWVVRDRGASDARLQALAPDRTSYAFDEATWTLIPLPREASASSSGPRPNAGPGSKE